MRAEQIYWKRCGFVAIQGRDGRMYRYGGSVDGLDFKFEGEKVGNVYGQFSVSILGLSAETINDLTVWNPAEALTNQRRIQVFAGYETHGTDTPIFDGIIMEAIPTNPPEMWLNMKCLVRVDKPIEKPYVKTDKAIIILNDIAKLANLKCQWISTTVKPDTIIQFKFDMKASKLIERFGDALGLHLFEENGILYADDKRRWYGSVERPQPININTGMIGIAHVDVAGAKIQRRLDDSAKMSSWIQLESKLMPKANGYYFIVRKKHKGHFRGDEWFTELEAFRKQMK